MTEPEFARQVRDGKIKPVRPSKASRAQTLPTPQSPQGAKAGRKGAAKSKYRNTKITVANETFDSLKEWNRSIVLRLLQKQGVIRNLERQVKYVLMHTPIKESYVADFVYLERQRLGGWKKIVEDVKGYRTRTYIRKRRLMKIVHGIEIRET